MANKQLTLNETLQPNLGFIWFQMRHWNEARPVYFHSEALPWLVFKSVSPADDKRLEIKVRGDQYGKTWRCWECHPGKAVADAWEDGEYGFLIEED